MAKSTVSRGNCYFCGKEYGKGQMKNHLKTHMQDTSGTEDCYLLKIEGQHAKNFWLFVDIPKKSTLDDLDLFLREIWLECCGHLSAFNLGNYEELPMKAKLGTFSMDTVLYHEYDFGSTTHTLVTIVGTTKRKEYATPVRLLARNVPMQFVCGICQKPAAYICNECMYEDDNPFYCESCHETHEHDDMMLPVTNSPRMGECGYDGGMDVYAFDENELLEN